MEEVCNFEEAREIFENDEKTMEINVSPTPARMEAVAKMVQMITPVGVQVALMERAVNS
ncbi:hypothetical protein L345_17828, partial [Ophiophagus hannah]